MRKLLSSLVVIVTILLTSCHKDELNINSSNGGDALLTINLSSSANNSLTRATQDAEEEQKINNAYLFVFNSGGGLVYSKFHTFSPQFDQVMEVTEQDVLSGKGMTIAVVANLDNQIMDASESTFADVASLEDLESLSTLMMDIQHPLQRTSSFLMSGTLGDITLSVDTPNSVNIPLVRTDAKLKFNITVDGETYRDITFTPTEWRVGTYTKRVSIFDTATPSAFAGQESRASNYGTYTSWNNYEQSSTTITTSSESATFAFYALESILEAGLIPATGTFEEQYALREKQVKNPDGTNQEVFEYAPAGATFVEFKGAVWYTISPGVESISDVTFKVHFGGIDNEGNIDVNNFNTYRNTEYTYNVTIKGISDIEVEVTDDNERRPGAEGEVVVADDIKELDAYNSVFNTTFNAGMIDESLRWDVSTIFSKGGKDDGATDYNWIHFRIHGKTNNAYNGNFREYPGDNQVYTAELDVDNDPDGVDAFITQYQADIADGDDKLLNVDQLVEVLRRCRVRLAGGDFALFDQNRNIIFTTFVKENYYDYSANSVTKQFEPMLWQQFVNTDKRVLNILSDYMQSSDKESSRSSAQISYRQATIQTMYNTESSGEQFSGFGSQFYPKSLPSDPDSEANFANSSKTIALYPNGEMTSANDRDNGRANCIKFINVGSDRWDKFINTTTWTLKSDYNYPLFKFLLYNRDMDGDGVIDANEIQWYLASINQLTDLWIGEDSFNPTSKLYLYSDWQQYKQHYISSTVVGGTTKTCNYERTNTWFSRYNCGCGDSGGCGKTFYYGGCNVDVLWASEGSSIGTLSDAGTCTDLYYRIVRNFGLENSSTAAADKVYTAVLPTSSSDGYIELSRLNSKSIRNNITGELPDHELRDPAGNNKVARKFAISQNMYGRNSSGNAVEITSGGSYTWKQINGEEDGYSLLQLPDNWRIPNQRELSLMYSVMDADYWPLGNHFSRTGFCDVWEDSANQERPGFAVTNEAGVLTLLSISGGNNAAGGVRPVKDTQ